jgi:hypothetical protein
LAGNYWVLLENCFKQGQHQKQLADSLRLSEKSRRYGMKKIIVLAAMLLLIAPVTAMAGMTAFMDMDELSNSELASTTGQTGITMNQTLVITDGYIAWGDDDGCSTTTPGAGKEGWLTLDSITASVVVTGLTIDVCQVSVNTTWLTIGQPAVVVSAGLGAIRVGSEMNQGPSLGELVIHSLAISGTTIEITGHP